MNSDDGSTQEPTKLSANLTGAGAGDSLEHPFEERVGAASIEMHSRSAGNEKGEGQSRGEIETDFSTELILPMELPESLEELALESTEEPSTRNFSPATGDTGVLASFENSQDRTIISAAPIAEAQEYYPAGSVASLAQVLVGQTLDHYQLYELVGGGGMGAVFKASDLRLERIVAVKVIPNLGRDQESLKRFRVEAQSAAKLDHPNIARVYYVGETAAWSYIVFEFVEGVNLRDLVILNAPISIDDAIYYTIQIAHALQHASDRAVVHRDIKPSNALVTNAGVVKVVDMGLARTTSLDQSTNDLTASGVTLGTFDYISPEQARDPRSADVRSDLYSLGCTLYYLLVGRPPYHQGTAIQKLLMHGETPPEDPRHFRDDIPNELVTVIRKLMAKRPRDRYQSPSDLIFDLQSIARDLDLPKSQAGFVSSVNPGAVYSDWIREALPWMIGLVSLLLATGYLYQRHVNSAAFGISQEIIIPSVPASVDLNSGALVPASRSDSGIRIPESTDPRRTTGDVVEPNYARQQGSLVESASQNSPDILSVSANELQGSRQPIEPFMPAQSVSGQIQDASGDRTASELAVSRPSYLPKETTINRGGQPSTPEGIRGSAPFFAGSKIQPEVLLSPMQPKEQSALRSDWIQKNEPLPKFDLSSAGGTFLDSVITQTTIPSVDGLKNESESQSLNPLGSAITRNRDTKSEVTKPDVTSDNASKINAKTNSTETMSNNVTPYNKNNNDASVSSRSPILIVKAETESPADINTVSSAAPSTVSSLAEAIRIANKDTSITEVWIDSESVSVTEPLVVTRTNLTIQSGPGRRARIEWKPDLSLGRDDESFNSFEFDATDRELWACCLVIDNCKLVLKDIDIDVIAPSNAQRNTRGAIAAASVGVGGQMEMRRGVVTLMPSNRSWKSAGVLVSGRPQGIPPIIDFEDVIVRGSGDLIRMQFGVRSELQWRNGLLAVDGRLLFTNGAPALTKTPPNIRLDMQDVTVAAALGLACVRITSADSYPVCISRDAKNCTFVSDPDSALITIEGIPWRESNEFQQLLPTWVDLRGADNSYDERVETLVRIQGINGELKRLGFEAESLDFFSERAPETTVRWSQTLDRNKSFDRRTPLDYLQQSSGTFRSGMKMDLLPSL